MHQAWHVIEMTREWVWKPFHLDSIPIISILQALTEPNKGKGVQGTLPSFPTQSLVCLNMVYGHVRYVVYFKMEEKGKGKKIK